MDVCPHFVEPEYSSNGFWLGSQKKIFTMPLTPALPAEKKLGKENIAYCNLKPYF